MATKLNLQADFAPVSKQAWKDKIIADLKGFSDKNFYSFYRTK